MRLACSSLASCAMLLSLMVAAAPPAASQGEWVILYESFDSGWGSDWNATDHNPDSGRDYWGVSTYRYHLGGGSAWCAQVGINSLAVLPPWLNSQLHYYDQDMQAALQMPLPDMTGYSSVTLSFYYWAVTGTTSLSDYLEVRVWTAYYWQRLWKQPDVTSDGWARVELALPTNTDWLSFSFISDDEVGLGPYEGAYVDTVRVIGSDTTPPVSSMAGLDEYQTAESIYIPYTAVDRGGCGVDHVELHYRVNETGSFVRYTTPDNTYGAWTDPLIPFDCRLAAGHGTYEFYTLAADRLGNIEAPPDEPDARTTFDATAPETVATVDGNPYRPLPGWTDAQVTLELHASDDISGVAVTMYRIGSGDWLEYDGPFEPGLEGEFNVSFRSEDRAGNLEAVTTLVFAIDTQAPSADLWTVGDVTAFDGPTASLGWTSEDGLSGIDRCLLKVDDRAFEFFSGSDGSAEVAGLADGAHTATLRAYDLAGNYFEATVAFQVDLDEPGDEPEPDGDGIALGWWAAMAITIAAAAAVVLAARESRRRA